MYLGICKHRWCSCNHKYANCLLFWNYNHKKLLKSFDQFKLFYCQKNKKKIQVSTKSSFQRVCLDFLFYSCLSPLINLLVFAVKKQQIFFRKIKILFVSKIRIYSTKFAFCNEKIVTWKNFWFSLKFVFSCCWLVVLLLLLLTASQVYG